MQPMTIATIPIVISPFQPRTRPSRTSGSICNSPISTFETLSLDPDTINQIDVVHPWINNHAFVWLALVSGVRSGVV